MRVLLTGANGQLGYELQKSCPASVDLIAKNSKALDITVQQQIDAALNAYQPDVVINTAAYTAVDKAESEQEKAFLINAHGPGLLAQAIASRHSTKQTIQLVHISTDFVFAGDSVIPYLPDSSAQPQNIYGASKLAGERAIIEQLDDALIIRTSWLYSSHGHNFVKTMLRLMQEKPQLNVVADQIGTPTWANTLSNAVWGLLNKQSKGVFHCADQGVASWYDFAVAIQEEALSIGLLSREIPIFPIMTHEYPTPAHRPAFSVLDKRKTETALAARLPHWRSSLRQMLSELNPN